MGTHKRALLVLRTNILDAAKQRLFHADLQKPNEERGDRLRQERCTGRDLDVVAQLEVLGKDDRLCLCLDGVAFEDLASRKKRGKKRNFVSLPSILLEIQAIGR